MKLAVFLCAVSLSAQYIPPGGGGGGGSPAFSAITNGTNTTAAMTVGSGAVLTTSGTGVMSGSFNSSTLNSGQTWDFSAGLFKIPTASGFTATASSMFGYDSTNTNPHIWDGADGILAPLASAPTNGNCIKAVVSSGKVTLADSGGACGGSGSPGGSTTQFQFNDSSSFNGTAGFTWDKNNPGLSLILTNPTQGNDPNDRRGATFSFTTDSTTNNPNFSNQNGLEISQTVLRGDASYGSGTNAKTTFIPLSIIATDYGSGQRLLQYRNLTALGGFSDSALSSDIVTYANGPINGDENDGGYNVISYSTQLQTLATATISSVPTQTTCNTTTTQVITGSRTAQTVTVASSTNCNVNDYVVIAQEAATAAPNEDVVKITAVAAGSITGVFRNSHASGVTVTPGVKLVLSGVANMGQDRWLVLTSGGSSYTTGTVASISGGGFTGSGTTWTNGMVGGSTLVPGCIALTNDDYTAAPFAGVNGPLKGWYPINTVASNTSLGIFTTSVAGDTSYHGNGVGSGGYTIKPCARILLLESSAGSFTNTVVLESNSFTWAATNTVEAAIANDADVSGFQYHMQKWNPGGIFRGFMSVVNTGARMGQTAYSATGSMASGGGADTTPWGTGYYVDKANNGFVIGETETGAAFLVTASPTNTTTKRPCYTITGNSIPNSANGLCGDYDTSVLSFTLEANPAGNLGKIVLDHGTTVDSKDTITAVGQFTFDGSRSGSNPPILTILAPSQRTAKLSGTNSGDLGDFAIQVISRDLNSDPFKTTGELFDLGLGYSDPTSGIASYGGFGAPKAAVSTSAATNAGSHLIWWNASVWNGSAAANRRFVSIANPGKSGNNAHLEWELLALTSATSYGGPMSTVFGVNDQGIIRFGEENIGNGSPLIMASLDPTNLTTYRTFKMMDQGGTLGVIVGSTLQKAETGAADSNVLTVTPLSVAGSYTLKTKISVSSGTSCVVGWTATWTDSNGNAQTPTELALSQTGIAAPALTFTTSSAGNYSGEQPIDVNNAGTNIVIKWIGGGTCAAKMSASVERQI